MSSGVNNGLNRKGLTNDNSAFNNKKIAITCFRPKKWLLSDLILNLLKYCKWQAWDQSQVSS